MDGRYAALKQWLHTGGATFDGVELQHSGRGGLSIFTTTTVTAPGSVIVSVPAELWLSQRTIQKTSGIAGLLRTDPKLKALVSSDNTWITILGLEFEMHNEFSPWTPYLASMDRSASPISWQGGCPR